MCHPALHWFIDWYTMPMPSYAYALWLYSFSTTCSFLLQLTFSTGKCATLHFTGCTRFSLTGALSRGIHNYFLLVEILIHPAIKLPLGNFRMTGVFCLAPEYFAVQAASSFWLPFRAKQCPSILMENYLCWISMEKSTLIGKSPVWKWWDEISERREPPTSSSLPSWESSLLAEHRLQYQITSAHHLTQ